MLKQHSPSALHRGASVALAAAFAVSLASAAWQTLEWSDADHKKVGRAINKYLAEKTSDKDREKARAEIVADLEKSGRKKGARTDEDAIHTGLASCFDLGRALAYSNDLKNLRGGKATAAKVEFGGESFDYALLLPTAYKPSGEPLPLVLCIPGLRDGKPLAGTTFLQDQLQEPALREGAVLAAVDMPADSARWSIVKDESGPGGLFALMSVYGDLVRTLNVDADRVFILGREQGALAAADLGARYPQLFAGVIAMAGDIGTPPAPNFCNLATFLQGGANSTAFEEATKQLGYNNCTIKADASAADVWSWIQQTRRVANPAKIVLQPEPVKTYNAYWLRIPRTEGLAGKITAAADRGSNTIRIDSEEVRSVTLFLNDAIVDLGKPITFVLNGREQQQRVARSLDDMLSLIARGTSDPGRVYVAQVTLDIPR